MTQRTPGLPAAIGRFRIDARIGAGGMGEVYKGFDPALMRSVAVKTVRPELGGQEYVDRLYREAQACARLQHPNIVTIYEVGEFDEGVFIAMEFLKGHSLATAVERRSLGFRARLGALLQILDALGHAHDEQVIHRDIKPSNVHVMPDGNIKLLDFGLARMESVETITLTGSVMGTPHYASPEQLRAERVDVRSDVFSTGALAYELFEGRRPFEADTISAILIKVLSAPPTPPAGRWSLAFPSLVAIIDQAMAKAPSERFQSVREMRDAVRAFMDAEHEAVAVFDADPANAPTPIEPESTAQRDAATEVTSSAPTAGPRAGTDAAATAPPSRLATLPPISSAPTRVEPATASTLPPDALNADPVSAAPARRWPLVLGAAAVLALGVVGYLQVRQSGASTDESALATSHTAAPPSTAPETPSVAPDGVPPATPVPSSPSASSGAGRAASGAGDPARSGRNGNAVAAPPDAPAVRSLAAAATPAELVRQAFASAPGASRNAGLKWHVVRKLDSGEEVEVDPDQTFHSGDRVRLAFESNQDGFLYVASQGSSRRWSLLFPDPGINGGVNAIARGRIYQVPDNGWFRFDDTPGQEELFVVLSKERMADLPGFKGRILKQETLPSAVVDDLRTRLASRDLVFEKDPPAPAGASRAAAHYVVNRDELGMAVSATITLAHAR
jgi:serine/threonine protein kinase